MPGGRGHDPDPETVRAAGGLEDATQPWRVERALLLTMRLQGPRPQTQASEAASSSSSSSEQPSDESPSRLESKPATGDGGGVTGAWK